MPLWIPEKHRVTEKGGPNDGLMTRPWMALFNQITEILGTIVTPGGIAPSNAKYILSTPNGLLPDARVLTDTSTIAWDFTTPNVAAAEVPDGAITFPKLQDIPAQSVIGREGPGVGDPEALGVSGNLEVNAGFLIRSALTGDVAAAIGSGTTTIQPNVVTFAKMQDIPTDSLIGRDTGGAGDPESIGVGGGIEFTGAQALQRSALTGDVTAAAGGAATTIANNAVTDAKFRQSVGTSVVGRSAGTTGNVADIVAGSDGDVLQRVAGALVWAPGGGGSSAPAYANVLMLMGG